MAYSNINRDKAQVKPENKLKTAVIGIILGVITISAWINIGQQTMILKAARNRNLEAEKKIILLSEENKKMEKEIVYATGSANLERKTREYLGMGNVKDHWLEVDLESRTDALNTEIPDSGPKPAILQWWELFSK